jgi:hypothetical protein
VIRDDGVMAGALATAEVWQFGQIVAEIAENEPVT